MLRKYILKVMKPWTEGTHDDIQALNETTKTHGGALKSIQGKFGPIARQLKELTGRPELSQKLLGEVAVFANSRARQYEKANNPKMEMMNDSVSTFATYLSVALAAVEQGDDPAQQLEEFCNLVDQQGNIDQRDT